MTSDQDSSPAWPDYLAIITRVCAHYAVTRRELESRDARSLRANFVRRVVALCLRERNYSLPEIAAVMQRNHTSVMRACTATGSRSRNALRSAQEAASLFASQLTDCGVRARLPMHEYLKQAVPPRYCTSEAYAFTSAALEMLAQAKAHEKARVWEAISEAAVARAA
jgi:hypothetical protein